MLDQAGFDALALVRVSRAAQITGGSLGSLGKYGGGAGRNDASR